ncbi:hypothetical protein BS47DRAFT_1394671 [Hydnum rufescens UP504]|uniref:Uncharacterized protein n=1 Tax=Hydnum rufescens UP504 TaxID=1448309 RepID=A0A9P6AU49_9AGAM|nr:hypothetical protein BS47DRAFT_1394671 [Hydnum rufescens UP504]
MSRGPFVGSVKFVQADDGASQEYIGVDVDLSWSKPDDGSESGPQKRGVFSWLGLQRPTRMAPKARVCAFKAKSGEAIGVGLFARPNWKHGHNFPKYHRPHHPHHPHGPHPGHPHWPFPRPPSGPEDPDEPRPPHRPHHPHHPCHRGRHYLASSVERDLPITAHVTVTIPSGPLALQAFSSAFPGLSQSAPSAFDDVIFGSVSIVSSHGQLDISNLKAANASIVTDGKPITGTFTVTEKLFIVTSNASVDVGVTLINNPAQDRSTILDITTKDAPITTITNLVLASPPSDGSDEDAKKGSFRISAVTSSAPLVVTIPSQPVSSALTLTAINMNDDVKVTLAPAYEGKFTLVTRQGGGSSVLKDEDTPDPEGKGRKRLVDIKALFGGTVIGSVSWVDADTNEALAKEQMEWEDELLEALVPEERAWVFPAHIELLTSRGDTKLFLAYVVDILMFEMRCTYIDEYSQFVGYIYKCKI